MTPEIERIDAELAELQAEIRRIDALPPGTVAERHAVVAQQLHEAEQLYRDRGLNPAAPHPEQQAHLQRLALAGMCMVVGADKLLKAEHQRIAAQGEGMSAADKARRLEHLRTAILAAAARREIALRSIERDREFLPRPVHPEFVVFPRAELERIAAR